MADGSHIEWTDATWNPITGCSVVSPGCTNCYAMKLAGTRLAHHPSRAGLTRDSKAGPVWTGEVRFNEAWLDQPLGWRKPRMIFVCAHGDLFAEGVPDEWIDKVFAVMALAPQHTFQVLTKRADRMRRYIISLGDGPAKCLSDAAYLIWRSEEASNGVANWINGWSRWRHAPRDDNPLNGSRPRWPLPNVWLGVSVEDQQRADERIPILLDTPAAVRWISAEPLLGPVRMPGMYPVGEDGIIDTPALDWVVAGGESGPGARPMHPDWVRSLRDQCAAAGVPFLFKQWGAWKAEVDRERDDPDWRLAYDGPLYGDRVHTRWLNLAGGRGFHGERFHVMRNVGKKAAARALDGVTHDGFPEPYS